MGSNSAPIDEEGTVESAVQDSEAWIQRLATFPEQNPNLVIETQLDGTVSYLNPVAAERFPDLPALGARHPLLRDLEEVVAGFLRDEHQFVAREVETGASVFEQKVCYTQTGSQAFLRIYAHDITPLRRAEERIQELARRVVHAQEEERHRVSRELHDEAGQALTALQISLQLLQSETVLDPQTVRSNLADAVKLVHDTRERIRHLAHGLRPPALDALGLDAALEDFCTEFDRRTHLQVAYRGGALPGLADEIEICLYRFLQEALTNAALHAEASRVDVTIGVTDDHVRLNVSDNGRGMDPAVLEEPNGRGLGLAGMRERIELLGGRLVIDRSQESGTLLVIDVPIDLRS